MLKLFRKREKPKKEPLIIRIKTRLIRFKDYIVFLYHSYIKSLKEIPNKSIFYSFLLIGFFVLVLFLKLNSSLKGVPLILLVVFFIFKYFRYSSNSKYFKNLFTQNIFIFGGRGTGKDLLMQKGVHLLRKHRKFVSNMDYGYSTEVVTDLSKVFDINNTFENFITGKINKIKKQPYEGYTMLISDVSIYFPSIADALLKKYCASFPALIALYRHLYGGNIIINTQVLGKAWKSIREQETDGAVKALGVSYTGDFYKSIPFFRFFLVVSGRYYENMDSAEAGLLPFKKVAVLNNISDQSVYMTSAGATKEEYNAKYGEITEFRLIVPKYIIKYDTRYFHYVLFGYRAGGVEEC